LQPHQRHPGRADRADHGGLDRQPPLDEAAAHRERERGREQYERGNNPEPLAVAGGCRVAVDRADHDRGDHHEAEWAQRVALAAEPLLGLGASRVLARAVGRVHGQTIERGPARRNGPDTIGVDSLGHAAARRRPRTWTTATREPTSISAISTSATGQAPAPIWWAMLKLRTAGSKPCPIANANAIRAPIPSTSSPPAIQPTRAKATPLSPGRTWVAKPPSTPSVTPTAASPMIRMRSLPAVGSVCRYWEATKKSKTSGTITLRRSSSRSFAWRRTRRTNAALRRYSEVVMPPSSGGDRFRSSAPGLNVGWSSGSTLRLTSCTTGIY